MAVDTAVRRRSALAVTTLDRLPLPDGTVSVGDRATLLGRYAGLSSADAIGRPVTLTIRDRGHTATARERGHTATVRARGHTATVRGLER